MPDYENEYQVLLRESIAEFREDFKDFKIETRSSLTEVKRKIDENTRATKHINGDVKMFKSWKEETEKERPVTVSNDDPNQPHGRPLVLNELVLKIIAGLVIISVALASTLTGYNLGGVLQ